jgi:soluble lytic murein transglycosylase
MRIMENVQVYRARLNGGRAKLTLSKDLKLGGYVAPPAVTTTNKPVLALTNAPAAQQIQDGPGTMNPISD